MLQHSPSPPPDQALLTLADQLTAAGFDTRCPAWEGIAYLKITNRPDVISELTIAACGLVTWEYRPCHPSRTSPAQTVGMVLGLLDPASQPRYVTIEARPDLALIGLTGRALASYGLTVALDILDVSQTFYDTYTELRITNPARPHRGTASLASDGTIWWECRAEHRAKHQATLSLADIAASIIQALAGAGQPG